MSEPVRHLPEPASLSEGGRVELRLARPSGQGSAGGVLYDARWFTKDGCVEGQARLDEHGEARALPASEGVPSWLLDFTCALLRLLARDHKNGAVWPRRLTRWRAAPESSAAPEN